MTKHHEIRAVHPHEVDRFAMTLALALCSDPSTRWSTPDAFQYMNVMVPLVKAFGGETAIEMGSAHVIGDFLGAALWLPPNASPDEAAVGEIFSTHVEEPHLGEIFSLFEAMAEHHPKEPHWYLWLMGIDPAYQRQGLGTALLNHALDSCDSDGTPAYLEATSPVSVRLYQRHGFDVVGEITVCGSPPMYPMVRSPK